MKLWQGILLAMLLLLVPSLSACDMLGLGNSKQQQQDEYYRQQMEAIQKVQEANRQQQDVYNQQLQQGLNEWAKAHAEWQKQQLQQQLGQVGVQTDNQG